ncbi:hypothetical protein JQ543_19870 [Bradyrhizobium diazoefficiens]|nr:hypothetical protein [Bradyrhizobium diazoefficiens]MBR0775327.1 hypothetical protein [Bradyrhizobium diazoefficiens]MBR0850019.1 hypothetical protein [Bradyrhizobium diazoefficiens]
MRRNFTLPELEATLSGLQAGAIHNLQRDDYERLFGENDAAVGRLRNFARGHNCAASFADGIIVFRKRVESREASRA